MSCIGAQSTSVPFEDFYFTVNGKHLLYEGPPEMEQSHGERAFVFRPERDSLFLQQLTEVGTQLNIRGGLPTAGCPRFKQHSIGDFTGTAVELAIGEPVIAPEASDGFAFLGNKLKSRMLCYCIAQALQFAVDAACG